MTATADGAVHLALHPPTRATPSGLPQWVCVVSDGLLAAGIVVASDLEGLDSDALAGLAICWVRSVARAEQVDGAELVEAAQRSQAPSGSRHAA